MREIVCTKILEEFRKYPEYQDMGDAEILSLVAFDDLVGLLKQGASHLWSMKNTLLPTLGPIIDKAISAAKPIIASLGGSSLPGKIKDALISDHAGFTKRAMGLVNQHSGTVM